jgi:RNA polymerase sigma-70 factor (ECF subfamily)
MLYNAEFTNYARLGANRHEGHNMGSPDNRDYFVEHIESCLDRLFGTAMRLTRNHSDAEDLVAETVTRGLDKIDTLKDRNRFVHWLLRIMTNYFISECRKAEKRTPHESYSEGPLDDETPFSLFEKLHQPFLLWWGTPEQDFLNKTLSEDISSALNKLPVNFRVAVMLSDVEGLSYQEIAQALGVPVGTVRSRLARGRSMMQKALWQHAQESGIAPDIKQEPGNE